MSVPAEGTGSIGSPAHCRNCAAISRPTRNDGVYLVGATAGVRRAYARTLAREVDQFAIFTRDLFATPNDEANRAAVAAVSENALDLVGIAVRGPRKTVDKILDKLRPLV